MFGVISAGVFRIAGVFVLRGFVLDSSYTCLVEHAQYQCNFCENIYHYKIHKYNILYMSFENCKQNRKTVPNNRESESVCLSLTLEEVINKFVISTF